MNTLDKQKFNQYRKVKFYIAVCFWIFSLSMFAGGSRKAVSENKSGEKKISGNRVEDEAIKIDIIINKDSNTDFENENEDLKKTDDFSHTVALKSKVFKALLKNTDGFFNQLFKKDI